LWHFAVYTALAKMGLILLVSLFPACLVAVMRRRRRRANFVVPLILALYALYCAAGALIGLIHVFAGLAGVDPSLKATLLARGISEVINCSALWFLVNIPIVVGAWIIDRWLRGPNVAPPS
jgi:hypothetical protein